MGEGNASSLVVILVVILSLIAFGFAIAAERRRSVGRLETAGYNMTYCVYDSDIATGYGVGSLLFLLTSESVLMGITKCMCFGSPLSPGGSRPLSPGGSRAFTIIYFIGSWITFLIAEICVLAGAAENAYHTKYRHKIYAEGWSCESLRKGVFSAGAAFVVFTMILNVFYYMNFSKARRPVNQAKPSVGMTGGYAA